MLSTQFGSFRMMVLGSSASTFKQLQALWSDSKISAALYGQFQLLPVLVKLRNHGSNSTHYGLNPSCVADQSGGVDAGDVFLLSAEQCQHNFLINQEGFDWLLTIAKQCDWLVFINDNSTKSADRALLLLIAERLRNLMPEPQGPQFHLVQPECRVTLPANWHDFYQVLDLNSRWLSVVRYRYLLQYQAQLPNQTSCKQQVAEFLYLLGMACVPGGIGPWLATELPAADSLRETQFFSDQVVLKGYLNIDSEIVEFLPPATAEFNADTLLLSLTVWPEDKFCSQPKLNFLLDSHHQVSGAHVYPNQLPKALSTSHLLMLQRLQPRPNWQLQGYWRLQWAKAVI